ncbi:pectinesterase [Musa troglodytarum]|uniref:Pectinesterase n=1 Tax=Musa troglodytarum TaxID=320322 RepID=A0A9E7FX15_9LILI|nr:pectinesterase [Musa troglodytarum]
MTSNVLAIVTNLDNTLDSLNLGISRKLLAEEYPSWVSLGKRRLLQLSPAELKPSVTVAQDGTGDVKTINDALLRVPKKSNDTFVIYIKEGVYKEKVQVNRSLTNVIMVGDGTNKTKITGSLNYIDGTATFKTATVAVIGDGFIGKDLWIENSAGAAKHQAVALRVQSDKSVFYNVRLDGYQDTLTCFYTELDNRGPGANTSQRVKWKGVKIIDYAHAQKFTVEHFIQGNAWLPKTGVPYIPGLLPMSEAGRIH